MSTLLWRYDGIPHSVSVTITGLDKDDAVTIEGLGWRSWTSTNFHSSRFGGVRVLVWEDADLVSMRDEELIERMSRDAAFRQKQQTTRSRVRANTSGRQNWDPWNIANA